MVIECFGYIVACIFNDAFAGVMFCVYICEPPQTYDTGSPTKCSSIIRSVSAITCSIVPATKYGLLS